MILLGKCLELYAKGRTAMAIHKLNSLKPKTARLIQGADEEVDEALHGSSEDPSGSGSGGESPLPRLFSASSGDKDRIIEASLLQKGDIIRIIEGNSFKLCKIILFLKSLQPIYSVL